MKPIRMMLALALALFVCASSFGGEAEFKRGEVIVEINPGVLIESINARYGTTLKQRLYNTNIYLLGTPHGKKENKWRKRLKRDADVISADLNPVVTTPSLFARSTMSFPDGFAKTGLTAQDFMSQTALFNLLHLVDVNRRSTGKGVVVALIDTGVDRTHPDLTGKMWTDMRQGGDPGPDSVDNDGDGLLDDFRGWDFVDNDNDPTEARGANPETTIVGHGTFIARIVTLLAPDCRIMPIRAFGPDGIGDAFLVATAIKYATDHGANVINLSLGSPDFSPLMQDAIDDARSHGVFLVAAVGNDNSEKEPQYPSSADDVLAVAAIDLTDHKASFSNFGSHVDVCAPGSQLISAFPGDPGQAAYAKWSGTSFAAPFAAAEAALILYVDRSNDVKKTIEDSALNIDNLNPGFAGKLGKGRIDPLEALIKVNAPVSGSATEYLTTIALTRGPGIQEGRGSATVKISGAKQALIVEASGIPVKAVLYKLFVNGTIPAGNSQLPTRLGTLRFELATGTDLPVQPVTNIRKVEIRSETGALILQGEFKVDSPTDTARDVTKVAQLYSPPNTASRVGLATVKLAGQREELSVQTDGLSSGRPYIIQVDGVFLGTSFTASSTGFLGQVFTNDGTGEPLPTALGPLSNIRLIQIFDQNRVLVRIGQFLPVTAASTTR